MMRKYTGRPAAAPPHSPDERARLLEEAQFRCGPPEATRAPIPSGLEEFTPAVHLRIVGALDLQPGRRGRRSGSCRAPTGDDSFEIARAGRILQFVPALADVIQVQRTTADLRHHAEEVRLAFH
jgi:hypothetical protein